MTSFDLKRTGVKIEATKDQLHYIKENIETKSMKAIALHLQVSETKVRNWIIEFKIPIKSKGGGSHRAKNKNTKDSKLFDYTAFSNWII